MVGDLVRRGGWGAVYGESDIGHGNDEPPADRDGELGAYGKPGDPGLSLAA